MKNKKIRVALLCDSPDEGWYSMDLVGAMLYSHLKEDNTKLEVTRVALPIRRLLSRIPYNKTRGFSADRFIHRFADYPMWIALRRARFDVFHVIDHSYSQLVRFLPAGRTVVTCHDLDAFSCILQSSNETRSPLFRLMTRSILSSLRMATRVVCDTGAIRRQLIAQMCIPEEKTDVVPLGVHPSFSPITDQAADNRALQLLKGSNSPTLDILHVGSTIPRKRIDVLLKVIHRLRRSFPFVRLLRVGGPFMADQQILVNQLCLNDCVSVLPYLDQDTLAAVYRQADIILVTSDAEGFGLPVLEGLASGKPVVASDLPVLKEVGGSAPVAYCPVGDVDAWESALIPLIQKYLSDPAWRCQVSQSSAAHASQFSWKRYSNRMVQIYSSVMAEVTSVGSPDQIDSNV